MGWQEKWLMEHIRGLALIGVGIAWIVGIALSSLLLLPPLIVLVGAGAACLCMVVFWHDRQTRFILMLLCCSCLGAWRYALVIPGNDPQAISGFIGPSVLRVRGVIADEPKLVGSQGRTRLLMVAVNSVSRDGGRSWQEANGQMEAQTLGTTIEDAYGANYGDNVELQGKLQPPTVASAPGIFASMAFPRITVRRGDVNAITSIIAFFYHLRVTLADSIARTLPQPEAALLIAIALSLRTPALSPLVPAFNVTGTAHMIAPSGFKVTILAGLVAACGRWLKKGKGLEGIYLLPAQKRGTWRDWLITAIVIGSIVVYTLLSGAGPAAIRAGVMGVLLVIAPRIGRSYNVYTALASTALLMSLVDPFILWDAGFQLSFLGTAGIVLLTPLMQHLLRFCERIPFGHQITEITAVTLAAQVATLPIFAVTFGQISFIAPLANALTVPLLGALITLGMLICGLGLLLAPLAMLCGQVVYPLLWYTSHVVSWCAFPGAYIPTGHAIDGMMAWGYYGVLALVLIPLYGRKQWLFATPMPQVHSQKPPLSRRAWLLAQAGAALLVILATGAMALMEQTGGPLTISFLDVGPAGQPAQGEAIFLRTPDGKTVLIDGGLDATSLAGLLDSRLSPWQRSLDALILTSTKADHITATLDVLNRYTVGMVVDTGMPHPNTTYARWRRTISERNFRYAPVAQGMTIPIGTQVMLQVMWPTTQLRSGSSDVRDNTLVVRLAAPGVRMLLLGEAAQSKYALAGLLDDFPSNSLQADIVQIVGEGNKAAPGELAGVMQEAHPALLIVTPAALSAAQRKAGAPSSAVVPPGSWQTLQTAQVGTVAINSNPNGWNMNIL